MTDLADPVLATMEVLRASGQVQTAMGTTTRIYGGELPADVVALMPTVKAIVVNPAGAPGIGPGVDDNVPVTVQRCDVLCYGRTRLEAGKLALAARYALKAWRPGIAGGVRVHWFKHSSGPIQFRDPDGDWPASVVTFNVMIDDVCAS